MAWWCLQRRLGREYEDYLLTSENFIYIVMIRLMTKNFPNYFNSYHFNLIFTGDLCVEGRDLTKLTNAAGSLKV
ncbi:hypothetical protein IAD21_00011 [Abditibacteriota bacterium]|nr:hypothetical protein IAD21_00011 [Abditibacteriota bacterium]